MSKFNGFIFLSIILLGMNAVASVNSELQKLEQEIGAEGCITYLQPRDQVVCTSGGKFSYYTSVDCNIEVRVWLPSGQEVSRALKANGYDITDIQDGNGSFWKFVLTAGIGTLVDEMLISAKAHEEAKNEVNSFYSIIENSSLLCANKYPAQR